MRFELMNKNNTLMEIETGDGLIRYDHINLPECIYDRSHFAQRRLAPGRGGSVATLLSRAHICTTDDFFRRTHAVSVTDTFWVREAGSRVVWESVSPWRNSLPAWTSAMILGDKVVEAGDTVSPDYTTIGTAEKCWKKYRGDIYMYKHTGEFWNPYMGHRVLSEYYAQQVAEALGGRDKHVEYQVKLKKTGQDGVYIPVARCKAFTSEDTALLEYAYIGEKRPTIEKIAERLHSVPGAMEQLQLMIVLDALILNPDRHTHNFGVLVDTDTFQIKGMAPVYDNDCSLGFKVSMAKTPFDQAYDEARVHGSRIHKGTWEEQAEHVMTPDMLERMASIRPFRFKRLEGKCDLCDRRMEFMEYIVNRQIENLLNNR